MPNPMPAEQVLNREFLEIRAKILELAASFDRLDRGGNCAALADDPRLARIREALAVLQADSPQRAEQVQLLFSREYEAAWRDRLGIKASS